MSTQPDITAKRRTDPSRSNPSMGDRWFRHVPVEGRRIVVDYSSSYPIIRKLSSTTSSAIVSKLKLIFSEFGIPDIFIRDNVKQYDSENFRKFEADYDFKHETRSPRYPQCNGKAERFVGTVKKTLQKAYEVREGPAIAFLCQEFPHLLNCCLTAKFSQTCPSSTP